MTSSSDYTDLLRTAYSGHKVQEAIGNLAGCFDINTIVSKIGYGKVEPFSELQVLEKVKEKFKEEFLESEEILNIVRVMAPEKDEAKKGKTKYYLSRTIRLLVFESGLLSLNKLGNDNDCVILIPVTITGSAIATVQDRRTAQETTFTYETGAELITTGKCSIRHQKGTKVVCAVLVIRKDKT